MPTWEPPSIAPGELRWAKRTTGNSPKSHRSAARSSGSHIAGRQIGGIHLLIRPARTDAQEREKSAPVGARSVSKYLLVAAARAQRFDIAERWFSKEAAIFADKLRRAFVANAQSRRSDIHALVQHAASGFMEPQMLLVLDRVIPVSS